MSGQEFTLFQENSNVVWMPNITSDDVGSSAAKSINQPYYRSQIFTASAAVNPLVAVAYPLLTLCVRLQEAQKYSDITSLYQLLVHEMRAFESQAKNQKYRETTVSIASYLLCVLIDQVILHTKWGKPWQSTLLLNTFHEEETSPNRVFQVIDRLLQHPSQYLDLLELTYLCLSFGLNNAHALNGTPEFLDRLDEIYRCIREERGEISQGFLMKATIDESSFQKPKTFGSLSLTSWISLSLTLVGVTYGVLSYILRGISTALFQQVSILSMN